MAAVRQAFLERGREIVAAFFDNRRDLDAVRPALALMLAGSGTTEFADSYSGVDLLVLYPDDLQAQIAAAPGLPAGPGATVRARAGGAPFKLTLLSYSEARHRIEARDEATLFALRTARVLQDPGGLAAELMKLAWQVPDAVWAEKAATRYREFRRRKASLAWTLRRGQPFLALENLLQLVEHALAACCCLAGQPPAGRKWLFQAAMRTPAGQEIRPAVFALLSSLGDVAVLGGSFNLRHNRLYLRVSDIQRTLEGALRGVDMQNADDNGGCG